MASRRDLLLDYKKHLRSRAQRALNDVDKQLRGLKTDKAKLVDLLVAEKIDDKTFNDKKSEYDIKRARLELERSELKTKEEDKERIVDNAARFLINLPSVWRELSLENKQKFQIALFSAEITVYPDQTFGTPQFSPIIEQVTEIEKYFSKNKVDLLERKSTIAGFV